MSWLGQDRKTPVQGGGGWWFYWDVKEEKRRGNLKKTPEEVKSEWVRIG